jgi:ferredoxin-NADP reductase
MDNPVLKIRPFRVAEITWETADTYTLHLDPFNPDDMIGFKAGQWVYLHLSNPDGTPWARAAYSIATSPEESGARIQLGIKLAGDFTKRGSKLMPDDVVGIQGPFGVFTAPPGGGPVAMFAAGIGITPFRSMIRSLNAQGLHRKIVLFYSNKTIEDTAYFDEFDSLEKNSDWFTPVFTLTQDDWPAPLSGRGERGRIDGNMLDRHVPDLEGYTFMSCGPRSFMDGMKLMLEERGIDTRTRLKQELFG